MTAVVGITVYTRERVSPFVQMPYATVNVGLSDLADEAGAVPLLLSPTAHVDDVLDRIDALVLQGGGDVHPDHYGQELHPATNTLDRRRDEFELALLARARERGDAGARHLPWHSARQRRLRWDARAAPP